MYCDELLRPWVLPLMERLDGLQLFDCHTHVGTHDPSGFSATPGQLLESLEIADSRAAVFPLKEPEGYGDANVAVARLAAQHPDRLVAFGRIDPADAPAERARAALEAGARGLKLHPAGEEFDIGDPRLEEVYVLADAHRLPIIVHAGPEIDGVGETALRLCERFPGAQIILAHDALTDLAWIHRHVDEHPNLFFDTSWWGPVHTMALFALVPPGRILSASDLPYCSPLSGMLTTARCGMQAGVSDEALSAVLGGQFERLLAGEEALDLGRAAGNPAEPIDPLLERVYVTLLTGLERLQSGSDIGNALPVTRHALKVPRDHPYRQVFRSVAELLDLFEERAEEFPTGNQFTPGWDLVAAAALIARTPDAPLPELG